MKLEIGKYYRTREGHKAGPVGLYEKATTPLDCFIGDVFIGNSKDPNRLWNADGTHRHHHSHLDLVAEWEDEMKITVDGKYAYYQDPYTQVRILCVDRNNSTHPILSLSKEGKVEFHSPTGLAQYLPDHDLVPLQEKLPDLWVVVYEDGGTETFRNKSTAEHWIESSSFKPKLCKYIPAPDQTS